MMAKEKALEKNFQVGQALMALPEGADILSVNFDWDPKYDYILLFGAGAVPEIENTETTVGSSGAVAKSTAICGICVKWYPREGNE